jgi:glycosyltransferase involved in cell wall biosynthesis
MITPQVSVLLPVYNAQDYLRESIDSILNQSFTDFELIIINDGSKDGSKEIIDSYTDPRIKVIDQDNAGLPVSLNRAIAIAKGKYLARQDADDVSLPKRLEEQVRFMDEQGLDICGCDFDIINQAGQIIESIKVPHTPESMTITLACTVPFAHGSVMMRKSFLDKQSLRYDESVVTEDYDLWSRIYQAGGIFGNVPLILFLYRQLGQSLSKITAKPALENTRALRRKYVKDNVAQVKRALEQTIPMASTLNIRDGNFLVLTAYLASLQEGSPRLFLSALSRSSIKSSAFAVAKILKGF